MCRDTQCPAVLTENLFQDNRADVTFLFSQAGRNAIVQAHVDGIIKYMLMR
jgi:N-acetylmuramoyl-L-alanine amidase